MFHSDETPVDDPPEAQDLARDTLRYSWIMYGIVANVISDSALRTGAKVWIIRCNGDRQCPVVFGMSKGGRRIEKYTHFKRLINFRTAWIPPGLSNRVCWGWQDREEVDKKAAALSQMWMGVRFFHGDGTMLKDGITVNDARRRPAAQLP